MVLLKVSQVDLICRVLTDLLTIVKDF